MRYGRAWGATTGGDGDCGSSITGQANKAVMRCACGITRQAVNVGSSSARRDGTTVDGIKSSETIQAAGTLASL